MTSIKFSKKGIDFNLVYKQGNSFVLTAENLYKDFGGDDESDYRIVDSINCGYKGNGVIKFGLYTYMNVGDKKINGVAIEDSIIIDQIEKLINDDEKLWNDNVADREANRIAPYVDNDKYVTYNVGCDTGLIYSEEKRPIIELAIKNGAKVIPVLRGERDETNKYPGQMDSNIDVSFARNIDGKWVAKGYKYLYEDNYCISIEDYNTAKQTIDDGFANEILQNEIFLKNAFDSAKETGNPVIISKICVHESETPLKNDGEDDIVDIVTYAMPDGTTEVKYFHNY